LTLGRSEGLGIAAATPGALGLIERVLSIEWATEARFEARDISAAIDIDARLRGSGSLAKAVHKDAVPADQPWAVDVRTDVPLAAHGPIKLRCAVADPTADGGLKLWVGTQDVWPGGASRVCRGRA